MNDSPRQGYEEEYLSTLETILENVKDVQGHMADGTLDMYDGQFLASVYADTLMQAVTDDEANKQARIANLIAVAQSEEFGDLHRDRAKRKLTELLGLTDKPW